MSKKGWLYHRFFKTIRNNDRKGFCEYLNEGIDIFYENSKKETMLSLIQTHDRDFLFRELMKSRKDENTWSKINEFFKENIINDSLRCIAIEEEMKKHKRKKFNSFKHFEYLLENEKKYNPNDYDDFFLSIKLNNAFDVWGYIVSGINIDWKNKEGETALSIACHRNKEYLLQVLIDQDIAFFDNSLLKHCFESYLLKGDLCAEVLIKSGMRADKSFFNIAKDSLRYFDFPRIQLLIDAGMDFNEKGEDNNPLFFLILKDIPFGCFGRNFIKIRVKNKYKKVRIFKEQKDIFFKRINILSQVNLDFNILDSSGESIVHRSMKCSNFLTEDIMFFLKNKGINVDCKNKDGLSALESFAKRLPYLELDEIENFYLLLRLKANPNTKEFNANLNLVYLCKQLPQVALKLIRYGYLLKNNELKDIFSQISFFYMSKNNVNLLNFVFNLFNLRQKKLDFFSMDTLQCILSLTKRESRYTFSSDSCWLIAISLTLILFEIKKNNKSYDLKDNIDSIINEAPGLEPYLFIAYFFIFKNCSVENMFDNVEDINQCYKNTPLFFLSFEGAEIYEATCNKESDFLERILINSSANISLKCKNGNTAMDFLDLKIKELEDGFGNKKAKEKLFKIKEACEKKLLNTKTDDEFNL